MVFQDSVQFLGYAQMEVVHNTCCLSMSEMESISNCSERPHLKAERKLLEHQIKAQIESYS